MRFVDLRKRNAAEDLQRGWSRQRENAVRTVNGAAPVVQRGDKHFFDTQSFEAYANTDDIRDGIQCANFVESNIGCRHAVNFTLCHGDPLKDGKRALLYKRR